MPPPKPRPRPRLEQRKLKLLWKAHPFFERLGLHVRPVHFYEPIPDLRNLPDSVFEPRTEFPGVDFRDAGQVALMGEMARYRHEWVDWPAHSTGDSTAYFQRNGQFERVDAEVHYAMIRMRKPKRIVEIGAGWSSLIALEAMARNRQEDPSYECELVSIEPYPREFLRNLGQPHRLINALVQDVPLDEFARLEAGDILFVDSSHVVKIGSDAQYEFLEVIPRVQPGVLVQVHDIFFPTDYPEIFVKHWQRFFNEQYVLEAFLSFNSSFEVRWGGSWMAHHHPDEVAEVFPSFMRGGMWPSSFWMERVS